MKHNYERSNLNHLINKNIFNSPTYMIRMIFVFYQIFNIFEVFCYIISFIKTYFFIHYFSNIHFSLKVSIYHKVT